MCLQKRLMISPFSFECDLTNPRKVIFGNSRFLICNYHIYIFHFFSFSILLCFYLCCLITNFAPFVLFFLHHSYLYYMFYYSLSIFYYNTPVASSLPRLPITTFAPGPSIFPSSHHTKTLCISLFLIHSFSHFLSFSFVFISRPFFFPYLTSYVAFFKPYFALSQTPQIFPFSFLCDLTNP